MGKREKAERAVRPLGIEGALRSLTNSGPKAALPPAPAQRFLRPWQRWSALQGCPSEGPHIHRTHTECSFRESQPSSDHILGQDQHSTNYKNKNELHSCGAPWGSVIIHTGSWQPTPWPSVPPQHPALPSSPNCHSQLPSRPSFCQHEINRTGFGQLE